MIVRMHPDVDELEFAKVAYRYQKTLELPYRPARDFKTLKAWAEWKGFKYQTSYNHINRGEKPMAFTYRETIYLHPVQAKELEKELIAKEVALWQKEVDLAVRVGEEEISKL